MAQSKPTKRAPRSVPRAVTGNAVRPSSQANRHESKRSEYDDLWLLAAKRRKRRHLRNGISLSLGILIVIVLGIGLGTLYMSAQGTSATAAADSVSQGKGRPASLAVTDWAEPEQQLGQSARTDSDEVERNDGEDQFAGYAGDDRAARFAVSPGASKWNNEGVDRKVVYLTFDDGPSAVTSEVLDILDRYGCKATFFVTAVDPAHASMIGETYRRGHTIGLHSASHDYATIYASKLAYFADLEEVARLVKSQIGYIPCFVRFPGGSSNNVSAKYTEGIMTDLVQEVQQRGFQYYDWNGSFGDGAYLDKDAIIENACSYDRYDNVILLCHDSGNKQATVEALPAIIEYYQAKGYSFEAIDRDTLVVHHNVHN